MSCPDAVRLHDHVVKARTKSHITQDGKKNTLSLLLELHLVSRHRAADRKTFVTCEISYFEVYHTIRHIRSVRRDIFFTSLHLPQVHFPVLGLLDWCTGRFTGIAAGKVHESDLYITRRPASGARSHPYHVDYTTPSVFRTPDESGCPFREPVTKVERAVNVPRGAVVKVPTP